MHGFDPTCPQHWLDLWSNSASKAQLGHTPTSAQLGSKMPQLWAQVGPIWSNFGPGSHSRPNPKSSKRPVSLFSAFFCYRSNLGRYCRQRVPSCATLDVTWISMCMAQVGPRWVPWPKLGPTRTNFADSMRYAASLPLCSTFFGFNESSRKAMLPTVGRLGPNFGARQVGPQLGSSWAKVGANWPEFSASCTQVGPKWAPVQPNLRPHEVTRIYWRSTTNSGNHNQNAHLRSNKPSA